MTVEQHSSQQYEAQRSSTLDARYGSKISKIPKKDILDLSFP